MWPASGATIPGREIGADKSVLLGYWPGTIDKKHEDKMLCNADVIVSHYGCKSYLF